MITDERLKWLSSADYAASEPGQIAGELLTARARIAQLEAALLCRNCGALQTQCDHCDADLQSPERTALALETKGEQSEV